MRILIVEDEPAMRRALVGLLCAEGYRVQVAADGRDGLKCALDENPDGIILDVMLPKLDGFAVCRELRLRRRDTPILMLTARGFVEDRVDGFDAGADDYLVKPFADRELLARLRALLRRHSRDSFTLDRISIGEVTVDFVSKTASRGEQSIELTAREFAVLKVLAESQGRPVSRDEFIDQAWEYNAYPTTRTVDNQILSLRGKLEPEPSQPQYILTVHRIGYRLCLSADE